MGKLVVRRREVDIWFGFFLLGLDVFVIWLGVGLCIEWVLCGYGEVGGGRVRLE